MAKGAIAKNVVIDKIKSAFGADFIGEYDKKIYVWANDGGENVQIAISLTCPKTPVMIADAPITGDFNFEDDAPSTVVAAAAHQPAEITQEEKDIVSKLMFDLGL
jgi:hypothetical protein